MAASRDDISKWFDEGLNKGATHMVVVCDTFDWDDYPVYLHSADAARKRVDYPGDMQRAMEVYFLGGDKAAQMSKRRCFQYE